MTTVRIVRLAAGGDGVGTLADGRVVFVPRSAPGDLVELGELKTYRRFARARIGRLLERSPHRVEPPCPHYEGDECGGCQLQHLSPESQRDARRGFVGDALRRLARRDVPDPDITPAGREFEYRTKLTLAVSADGRQMGLHRYGRADQLFDLDRCLLTAADLMALWQAVRSARSLLPPGLTHVVLRQDRSGGRHLLLRVNVTEPWEGAARLHRELLRQKQPATIWWEPARGAGAARPLAGTDAAYPATVFEQVNPDMGDQVRAFAVSAMGEVAGRPVWDLYAGVGETTAMLVRAGGEVESVEADARAVDEAERRGPPARRLTGRVEDLVERLRRPELVLTNPPRTGMDARVTGALERLRPIRVVYLACDPATLARDVARLPGYRLARLQAFDLFPQTAHVEAVAVLERAP